MTWFLSGFLSALIPVQAGARAAMLEERLASVSSDLTHQLATSAAESSRALGELQQGVEAKMAEADQVR